MSEQVEASKKGTCECDPEPHFYCNAESWKPLPTPTEDHFVDVNNMVAPTADLDAVTEAVAAPREIPKEIAHALWYEGYRLHSELNAALVFHPENWNQAGLKQNLDSWEAAADRYHGIAIEPKLAPQAEERSVGTEPYRYQALYEKKARQLASLISSGDAGSIDKIARLLALEDSMQNAAKGTR